MSGITVNIESETCKHCTLVVNEKYIINSNGELFCTEDCFDSYMELIDRDLDPHPYEDQYLSIRSDYIDLLENWEERLSSTENYLEAAVDRMYEEVDGIIEDYSDFIHSEGDDGAYAWEIYQYTLKLQGLQREILAWRPNRKIYYWVSTELGQYGARDERDTELFNRVTAALYRDGYGEDMLEIVKNHAHPYHWGLNLVFDRDEDASEVYKVFKPYFQKYEVDIELEEAHRCEAGCGDIVGVGDEDSYVNGFFYCYSHRDDGNYGIYSETDLLNELKSISNDDTMRQVIIDDKNDWCYPFREMIKRSCRTYQQEIPDWAY